MLDDPARHRLTGSGGAEGTDALAEADGRALRHLGARRVRLRGGWTGTGAERDLSGSDPRDIAAAVLAGEQAVQDAEARLRKAKDDLEGLKAAQQAAQKALEALAPVDPEAGKALQDRLEKSQEVNRQVDMAEALEVNMTEKRDALTKETAESERLTVTMEERTKIKTAAIAAAKMPIDGLSLESGRVMFNGIPLDQGSSAEQLRVSTAIAMSSNPELRVIRIKDGSLLDPDGMAMVKEMAKENDFQIWIERVADNDPIAVVIEDGSVASTIQAEAA
jgi:hypothetical protein